MSLTPVTPPSGEPVSLDEAKAHLRVTDTASDTYITALITAVRQQVETITKRALMTQTWDLTLDAFPLASDCPIEVPLGSLQSVTTIHYQDMQNVTQLWGAGIYFVDTKSVVARVLPVYGQVYPYTWPSINAVSMRFVCGYGAATDVPLAIKQAMLLILGHFYENRMDVVIDARVAALEIPQTSQYLLAPYKISWFA